MHWWKKAIFIIVVSSIFTACGSSEAEEQKVEKQDNFLQLLANGDFEQLSTSYADLDFDSSFVANFPSGKVSKQTSYYFPNIDWKSKLLENLKENYVFRDSTNLHCTLYHPSKKEPIYIYNYPPDTSICVLEIHE